MESLEKREVSEVSFGGPALALSDVNRIEANQVEEQKAANEQLDGLLENLGLGLPMDVVEEDERREAYALAASVFG
jgi:hypothetical protein